MKKIIILIVLVSITFSLKAQPYVDLLSIRYNNGISGTLFSHLYVGSDLPIKLKNNGYIVISPFFENWNINNTVNEPIPAVSSLALATSAILPIDKKHWSLTITAIPRINSEELSLKNSFQIGGALLAIYKKSDTFKYKFGVYVNKEFFGLFVMPLVGVDWKINQNNYVFGVLPGKLIYEHQLNTHLYTGLSFRAITNSYKLADTNYIKIQDNQLSSFVDYYATKHIVFSGETGWSIMRKLTGGTDYNNDTFNYCWQDGLFFKLSVSYRMRL